MATSGTGISIVYMLINLINGKRYIGVTSREFNQRWSDHCSVANTKPKYPLHHAIKKYGRYAFLHTILGSFTSYKLALSAEIDFIEQFKPEYNITRGGEGVSFPRSKEFRERMSALKKANPSRSMLGKTLSDAARAKIRAAKLGVPRGYTPEHALEVFRGNMRRAAIARRRPVICTTTGHRFESLTNAAIAFGLRKSALAHVCSGKRNSIYGLVLKYEEADGH